MLGIPTRSEVKDPAYQRAVHADDLRSKLHEFRYPTSTTTIDNHLNTARLRAQEEGLFASPKQFLNPEHVLATHLFGIRTYREALDEAEKEGFVYPTRDVNCSHDQNIYYATNGMTGEPIVRPRTRKLDERLVHVEPSTMQLNRETRPSFRYTFKPAEVVRAELDAYEAALAQAYASSGNPKAQLAAMRTVVGDFDESATKRLVVGNYLFSHEVPSPFSLEHNAGTEAYQRRQANEEIAAGSDAYIRFDEVYVIVSTGKGQMMLPLVSQLANGGGNLVATDLSQRQSFRDTIDGIVDREGGFVFNGVNYQRDERGFVIASPQGKTFPGLVNVLGASVTTTEGTVNPEPWAAQEVRLVDLFRNGNEGVVDVVLDRYQGFNTSTKRYARENAEHVLRLRRE